MEHLQAILWLLVRRGRGNCPRAGIHGRLDVVLRIRKSSRVVSLKTTFGTVTCSALRRWYLLRLPYLQL